MPATMSTRFESNLRTKFGIDSTDLNVSVHQLQQDQKSLDVKLKEAQREVNRITIFRPDRMRKFEKR